MVNILLWILGVAVYLIIGGFVAEMMDVDPGIDTAGVAIIWPFAAVLWLVFAFLHYPVTGVAMIGALLADHLKTWIRSRRYRNRHKKS